MSRKRKLSDFLSTLKKPEDMQRDELVAERRQFESLMSTAKDPEILKIYDQRHEALTIEMLARSRRGEM